jgi:hypothetical protein
MKRGFPALGLPGWRKQREARRRPTLPGGRDAAKNAPAALPRAGRGIPWPRVGGFG